MTTEVLEQTVIETPPSTEEQPLQGEETPNVPVQEEVVVPPAPLTLADLNAKAEREGLSAEEFKAQARLQQSDNDRRANEARYVARIEAEQQARLTQLQGLTTWRDTKHTEVMEAEMDAAAKEGRTPSRKLIRDQQALITERYDSAVADIHLEPVRATMRQVAARLIEPQGASARTLSTLNSYDETQLLKAIMDASYALGQAAGPGSDKVVMTKADHEKLLKGVGDEVKRAQGLGGGSVTSNGSTTPVSRDANWLLKLPPEEYAKVSSEEKKRILYG